MTDKNRKRLARWLVIFLTFALLLVALSQMIHSEGIPTVATDKADYYPGETVTVTGTGWFSDTAVALYCYDTTTGAVALNRTVDVDQATGSFSTTFQLFPEYVPDYDLTATGTSSLTVARATFTDSAGSYTLKWYAADPALNKGPYLPTYTKIKPTEYSPYGGSLPLPGLGTGRASDPMANAVAYASPPIPSNLDAVTSLMPKDLALGQIVPFELEIVVNGSITPENGTITFDPYWLTKVTNGADFGFDPYYKLIAAFVDYGDPGTIESGTQPKGPAKVDTFSSTVEQTGTSNEQIVGHIQVSGLDDGDRVIVELWVVLKSSIGPTVGGNVQTGLVSAQIPDGSKINIGNQTVPLLQVGDFYTNKADLSITKTDEPDPVVPEIGLDVTYKITATNNSPDTMANGVVITDTLDPNVTLVDAGGGTYDSVNRTLTWNVGSLAPTASIEKSFKVTVSTTAPTENNPGTDADPGSASPLVIAEHDIINKVALTSITSDPTPGNNTYYQPTNVIAPKPVIVVLVLKKVATPTTYDAVGDVISYTYTLTNKGNVDLVGPFTVTDDKATATRQGTVPNPDILAPDASITFTASYTITQTDLDNAAGVKNTAQGHGYYGGETVNSNYDDETVTPVQAPAIELLKNGTLNLGTDGIANVGDTITYTFSVKNTGNVTLTNISVSDPKVNVVGGPLASLAAGATDSTTFTGSYTLTQADIDAGTFYNMATATGTPPTGPPVTDDDDDTQTIARAPALKLVKTATPATYDAVGNVISYSYKITNSGNVTLTGPFTVTDDKATVTVPATASLAPGASVTGTASYTITQADLDSGSVKNTAQAHGFFGTAAVDSNFDDETVTAVRNPALKLEKSAVPHFSTPVKIGDTIDYTLVATNTGNVTLHNVTISDALLGTLTTVPSQPATLAPGATLTVTGKYTITQADIDAGKVHNVGIADSDETPPTDTPHDETVPQNPHISLTKVATETSYDAVGQIIHYTLVATNDGNVTLTNVSITDPKLGTLTTDPAQPATLAPGAKLTATGTHTVTQTDLNAGKYDNTATVNGTSPKDQPVSATASASVPAVQKPSMTIKKYVSIDGGTTWVDAETAPGPTILVGLTVKFKFVVKNTGNVTLSTFTVIDDQYGAIVLPAAVLAPDKTMEKIIEKTAAAGQHTNTVTVNAKDPMGKAITPASDKANYFGADPQIKIVKKTLGMDGTWGDGVTVIAGKPVTWRYEVSLDSTGNVPLGSISVSDDKSAAPEYKSGDDGDKILESGETWIFEATGIAIGGSYSNTGTAKGSFTDAAGNTRTDTATDPSSYTGKVPLNVIKTVNQKPFSGPELTFELRQGAAPVSGAFGTVLETAKANSANGGVVAFNTLLVPGVYQFCEYVPEGYVPSYIWGVYGVDWFKPGYAPNEGSMLPYVLIASNFTVKADGTIDFQNGHEIVGVGGAIHIDNQFGQMPRTIGYWKNHAASKESNGGQTPVLDQMLYKASTAPLNAPIVIGLLNLSSTTNPNDAGTASTNAVRLLNKSAINTNKKMASDPCFDLAAQLLAYRLNQVFGAWPNDYAQLAADYAQQMLVELKFDGTASHLKPSAKAAANLTALAKVIDAFNNDTLVKTPPLVVPYPGVYK